MANPIFYEPPYVSLDSIYRPNSSLCYDVCIYHSNSGFMHVHTYTKEQSHDGRSLGRNKV